MSSDIFDSRPTPEEADGGMPLKSRYPALPHGNGHALAEIVRRKNRREAGRLNLNEADSRRSTSTDEGRVLMGQQERRAGSVDRQEVRSSGSRLDVELHQSTDETAGC
jgi:hypothetical protein